MIISNQQIAVHFGTLRNLTFMTSGRYSVRIGLNEKHGKNINPATPVCIIEQQPRCHANRSEFDDQHFITRVFPLKSAVNVDINEVYIFKLDSPITCQKDDVLFVLTLQMFQVQGNSNKLVTTYNATINGQITHEYLQIDFYDSTPCQILGSFHRCSYKFQFQTQDKSIDIKQFCQKYYQQKIDQLVQYLTSQGIASYKELAQKSSLILKEQIQIDCIEKEKPILLKMLESEIEVWEEETQLGSNDSDHNDSRITNRKKRPKIFSISRDCQSEQYQIIQKNIHEYAQKIYQLWRELLRKLFSTPAKTYFAQKAIKYHHKLQQKIKESVSSFKGSWDNDIYGQEVALRQKLASQLRQQHRQLYGQLNPSIHNEFPNLHDNFFTSRRPIIFEERASKNNQPSKSQQIGQIFVVMVHGLGACRIDMERTKVQLKRYYEKKVRIYISTANQGRTESDIDGMGMRLAAQLDYELTKFNHIPKICMIGHSMGGLIIRSALPRLEKYKNYFHSLVTLSSPHLGYGYSSSKLVDAGIWFMNTVKKCTSLIEMTMNDHQTYTQTYLYKLSQKPGLEWFKKKVFLSSHQDSYVPYYSARIQKHSQSLKDERNKVKKGQMHCEMIDNMLYKGKGQIIRLDVNFSIPQQNLDNFIGRAAHISFINNNEMIRTLVLAGKHYFF